MKMDVEMDTEHDGEMMVDPSELVHAVGLAEELAGTGKADTTSACVISEITKTQLSICHNISSAARLPLIYIIPTTCG